MNPIGLATEGGWVKDRKSVLNTRFMLDFNVPGLEGLNLKGIFSYDKIFNSIKRWTTPVDFYVWNKITGEYDGHSPNREGAELKQNILNQSSHDIRVPGSLQQDHCTRSPIGSIIRVLTFGRGRRKLLASRTKYRIYLSSNCLPDRTKTKTTAAVPPKPVK